jgi:ParB/RepB/Spo0J family partition protein
MDLGTVRILSMSDILFDESKRGRVDYGDIDDLARSIREQGLMEPLVVYSPTLVPPFELLAGGRRYKALQRLGATLVSVRIYDHELTDKEKRIIELYENLKRKELSHIERANMTFLIDETLKSIHGKKLPGPGEGHSTRETARLLGVSQQTVNNDIKIAKAHSQFPELALGEKKNASAALHTINRLEYAIQARIDNPNISMTPLGESYILGDFFEAALPQGEFSFIEIDPPYGIDLGVIKKLGHAEEYNEVTEDAYINFLDHLIEKCTNAAADNCYLVLWAPPQWYYHMYTILVDFGWDVDHVPALWFKNNSTGQSRSPEYWLGGSYEPFIYARRGNARIIKEGRSNVFSYPVIHPSYKVHPTEKPQELMRDIITTFCVPGGNILVPFAGSGVTIATAHTMGHSVIGYDLSVVYREAFLTKFVGGIR